jgi:hypothetical protein
MDIHCTWILLRVIIWVVRLATSAANSFLAIWIFIWHPWGTRTHILLCLYSYLNLVMLRFRGCVFLFECSFRSILTFRWRLIVGVLLPCSIVSPIFVSFLFINLNSLGWQNLDWINNLCMCRLGCLSDNYFPLVHLYLAAIVLSSRSLFGLFPCFRKLVWHACVIKLALVSPMHLSRASHVSRSRDMLIIMSVVVAVG